MKQCITSQRINYHETFQFHRVPSPTWTAPQINTCQNTADILTQAGNFEERMKWSIFYSSHTALFTVSTYSYQFVWF